MSAATISSSSASSLPLNTASPSSSSSRKLLLISTLSIIVLTLSIISVSSNFAVVEQKNQALNNEIVQYTFDLFEFCRYSDTFNLCTGDGAFDPCSTLDISRSASAAFLIMMIIIQSVWVIYLLCFNQLSENCLLCYCGAAGRRKRRRRRQQREAEERERERQRRIAENAAAAAAAAATPSSSSSPNGRRRVHFAIQEEVTTITESESNSEADQQQEQTTTAPSSAFSICVSNFHLQLAQFFANKQNFRRIFAVVHVLTLFFGFLGWSVGFSLTVESHCGKKILEDFVPIYRNTTIVTDSRTGPSAPVGVVGWVLQIVVVLVFWKTGEGCGVNDDDNNDGHTGHATDSEPNLSSQSLGEYREVV